MVTSVETTAIQTGGASHRDGVAHREAVTSRDASTPSASDTDSIDSKSVSRPPVDEAADFVTADIVADGVAEVPAPADSAASTLADPPELSGLTKAAVFILSLDEEAASRLLRCLSDTELSTVTEAIANLGVIPKDTVADVLGEFHDLERASGIVREGGCDAASRLIRQSFATDKAAYLIETLERSRNQTRFAFLSEVNVGSLVACLDGERSQTVALVLAHSDPTCAAEVLERFTPEKRQQIVRRIASLEHANDEAISLLEKELKEQLAGARFSTPADGNGVQAVAKIVRAAGERGTTALLDELREERPQLAEAVSKHFLVFEELVRLDDRFLRAALKRVSLVDLAVALNNSGRDVLKKVSRNLGRRSADRLSREIDRLGPVRLSEVEATRRRVLEEILGLKETGLPLEPDEVSAEP